MPDPLLQPDVFDTVLVERSQPAFFSGSIRLSSSGFPGWFEHVRDRGAAGHRDLVATPVRPRQEAHPVRLGEASAAAAEQAVGRVGVAEGVDAKDRASSRAVGHYPGLTPKVRRSISAVRRRAVAICLSRILVGEVLDERQPDLADVHPLPVRARLPPASRPRSSRCRGQEDPVTLTRA
jgi:hypothetical protein